MFRSAADVATGRHDVLLVSTYRDLDEHLSSEQTAGQPRCPTSAAGQPQLSAGGDHGGTICVVRGPNSQHHESAAMMTRSRKLRYGSNRHQFGVFQGAASRKADRTTFATVVLIHGGSWRWPYNRWVMSLLARDARRRGWAVFNVEYRRLGRFGGGGGWPETFDDARAAIETMTNDTASLGIDTDRVVVVGHSAGGHLALVGSATASARPALVVSMAGPTDLERLWSNGSQPVIDLTEDAPAPTRWSVTSPIHMLPVGSPVLCVHGEADTTVHPMHSTVFVEAARSAGDVAEVVLATGESHKDALKPTSAIWASVADVIVQRVDPATSHETPPRRWSRTRG